MDQRRAIGGADFVIVTFQIGGYSTCTVTNFDLPKRVGLRQTIAGTRGIGGIMRGLRTVPHLWKLAEDMRAVCPNAIKPQYVNPMAINTFGIPLDEYPIRCEGQIARWAAQAETYRKTKKIVVKPTHEYATMIMKLVVTGTPSVIYGNVPNRVYIPQLPPGTTVDVPTLVDANEPQPTTMNGIPPQLIALIRTNVNVQELTVAALLNENRAPVYHAAKLDPRTAAELDLCQIRALVDDLIEAHGEWMPARLRSRKAA